MTIAGSVYVACIFFLLAGLYQYCVSDLEWLAHRLTPFLTYVAVMAVALSYIFGFVAHRVIQMLIDVIKIVLGKTAKGNLAERRKTVKEKRGETLMEEMTIWALCSHRVHREMDFQYTQVALLRSLLPSSVLLGLAVGFWSHRTCQDHLQAIAISFLSFVVLLVFAFCRQNDQYKTIRTDALLVARTHPDYWTPILSPDHGKAATRVTIRGINFGKTQQNCAVTFGTKKDAPLLVWEPTHVILLVPSDLGSAGPVHIKVEVDIGKKGKVLLTCPPFTLDV